MGDLVRAAKPWAKTSARTGGTSPLSRMGGCRVLVLEDRDCQRADEPTHWLMLGDAETGQERDPARRPQARPEAKSNNLLSSASGDAPANQAAQHAGRGDGWRGSAQYRRPASGAQRAPAGEHEPFHEDSLEDVGR